ncbi:HET-domain-containing protein [Xylariaceae sp. FL0662B]|nr:HET-domain-containing protein [Xylariaceae sp. FL0662B]
MVKLSLHGAQWFGERVGYLINGVFGATLTWFFDWLIPKRLKLAYVLLDHLYRARRVNNNLVALRASKTRRILTFAGWLGLLSLFQNIVPARRYLMIYHGMVSYVSGVVVSTLVYLQSDGPPGPEHLLRIACRDAALVYGTLAYSLTHRPLLWRMTKWIFIRFTLPILCLAVGVYVLREWVSLTPLRDWVLCRVIAKIPAAWDQLDVWEAQLMERLPQFLQHKWSSYQQNLPQRRSIPIYQYKPLRQGEIRLLVLRRSRWLPSVLQAELIHSPVYPPLDYEALSYRWGSSDRTDEILVDGYRFPVTKSAFNLLLARRSVWRERKVWIDAICINQEDDQEKSTQVQLMRDIYYRASRVIVYPGGGWQTRLAAPLIFELFVGTYQFDGSGLEFNSLYSSEWRSPRWRAMTRLFTNEYFSRAWIIQEVAVGQKVELYFGGLYIPWAIFFAVASSCFDPHRRNMLMVADRQEMSTWIRGSSFENIATISILRPDFDDNASTGGQHVDVLDFQNILFVTCKFGATDPRDKVFSLVGIARGNAGEELIKPDYDMPVEQVFQKTMQAFMSSPDEHKSIHLLALAGTGFSEHRRKLPSWVPDLSEERLCYPYTNVLLHYGSYAASGDRPAKVILDGPDRISVRGIEFDRISELGRVKALDFGVEPGAEIETLQIGRVKYSFVQDATEVCRTHGNSPSSGEDIVDQRLWMALVAGRIARKPAEPKFRETFYRWLLVIEAMANSKDQGQFGEHIESGRLAEAWPTIQDGTITSFDLGFMEGAFGRRFAISEHGRLCLVPPLTKVGDSIFIPFGAQTPFIIRRSQKPSEKDGFELIGEAFVEGVMYGEAMEIGEEITIQLL